MCVNTGPAPGTEQTLALLATGTVTAIVFRTVFLPTSFHVLSTSCVLGTVPVTVKGRSKPLPDRADMGESKHVNKSGDRKCGESKEGEAWRVLEGGAWTELV